MSQTGGSIIVLFILLITAFCSGGFIIFMEFIIMACSFNKMPSYASFVCLPIHAQDIINMYWFLLTIMLMMFIASGGTLSVLIFRMCMRLATTKGKKLVERKKE